MRWTALISRLFFPQGDGQETVYPSPTSPYFAGAHGEGRALTARPQGDGQSLLVSLALREKDNRVRANVPGGDDLMPPLTALPIYDRAEWNALLRGLPCAHILQTWEWGEFKRAEIGWIPERLAFYDPGGAVVAAASVLTRRIGPLCVLYVPKGPALDYADSALAAAVLGYLERLARRRRAVWLKIDPDVVLGTGIPGGADPDQPPRDDPAGLRLVELLRARGWRFSASQVQFRNTLTLDLRRDEAALLAAMNQSTRRKLRIAQKAGVTVRPAAAPADLRTLYDLYAVTGERQGFLIRPPSYYRAAWEQFIAAGLAQAFIAERDGVALAGLVLFHFGPKAWYFYGMSANVGREHMPAYLVQWEAIRWARAQGYPVYDFWGAPDTFSQDDPMWGVYRFKDGFGGTVVRHIGAWDYAPSRALYWVYEQAVPRALRIMKRLARRGGGN